MVPQASQTVPHHSQSKHLPYLAVCPCSTRSKSNPTTWSPSSPNGLMVLYLPENQGRTCRFVNGSNRSRRAAWNERFPKSAGTKSRNISWVPMQEQGRSPGHDRLTSAESIDRLVELKAVIAKVHGGKYRWTWKKFNVAMESMGCKSSLFSSGIS